MNVVSILFYYFIEFIILFHYIIHYFQYISLYYFFLVISFARYNTYMIGRISFSKFLGVVPACTCARAVGNPWSIFLGASILRPLPFCWLLKSRIFSTIPTILFGFSFWRISFSIIAFLKSINASLASLNNSLFLVCLDSKNTIGSDD